MAINSKSFDEKELLEFISNELPRLIVERPEIRYEIMGIVSDKFAEKSELAQILSEIRTLREDLLALREDFKADNLAWRAEMKELKEKSEADNAAWRAEMKKLREDNQALREEFKTDSAAWRAEMKELKEKSEADSAAWRAEMQELKEKSEADSAAWRAEMKELRKDFQILRREIDNKFSAIGAKWGINSEKSFRDGLKGILKDLRGIEVKRLIGRDKQGTVFGRPDQVELDVVVKDGVVILIEIKSSMSRNDVATFQRKVDWYEKEYDVKVDRKIIISPMVAPRAIDEIDYYHIEMYSGSDADI